MFKIKTPGLQELEKLNLKSLQATPLNKITCLIQNFIPHNMRTLPSIHIAVEENNILGYIILQSLSKPNNCWQIDEVFVQDEIRNKGIGEELLRYVLSIYGGYGIEHFLAEVDSQNFPALSLFHECGFRRYAKVGFYEKEFDLPVVETCRSKSLQDENFAIKIQTTNDLNEIEKLELSSIPPDLRPALGRSKNYFKEKKDAFVLIDKSRNIIVGWANKEKITSDKYLIELLINPGWTYLYEQFLNVIISELSSNAKQLKIIVKAIDYLTDLRETLTKSGFLQVEIKELLVRTIWQKAKERKKKSAKVGMPSIAPT